MAKENISRYVILGLLGIKSMSGYDIKHWISRGVGHFWCISYGQIYPILKSLLADGLATHVMHREEGKPEKKIYTITTKGKEELKEWLRRPLDFKGGNYSNMLTVKLYFGSNVEKETIIQHLLDAMKHEREKLDNLWEVEKQMNAIKEKAVENNDKSYAYRMCTLSEGIIMAKAQIEWHKETIAILSKEGE